MLMLKEPTAAVVRRFLAAQAGAPLTYQEQGATCAVPPDWAQVDRTEGDLTSPGLGQPADGLQIFERACQALREWTQFKLGWVSARPSETPIQTGEVVAIVARVFGVWSLSACRIVQVIDEPAGADGLPARFGFCYGTLPDHVARGEERFLVEYDPQTGRVRYEIFAFSKPRTWWIRAGRPVMRRLQKRFGRESVAAMQAAVRAQPARRESI